MPLPREQVPAPVLMGPATKRCKRCLHELPLENFFWARVGTLSSRCRSCHGLELRRCVVCGAEFEGRYNAKLCSHRCRRIYRPQTFLVCRHCGRTFGPVGHLGAVYCSTACKNVAQAVGRKPPAQCNRRAKAAQRLVRYYIDTGRLYRPQECSRCGRRGRIEAAHADYDLPLTIRWLCRSCHVRWDRQEPKGGCTEAYQPARGFSAVGNSILKEDRCQPQES